MQRPLFADGRAMGSRNDHSEGHDPAEAPRHPIAPSVVAGAVAALVLIALGAAGAGVHPGAAFDAWIDVSMPVARLAR
jgi:hypothetical protein